MALLSHKKYAVTPQNRLKICNTCPELLQNVKPLERCKLCGCVMRAKVLIPSAKCPKGLWN